MPRGRPPSRFFAPSELAELFGCSEKFIRRAIDATLLPADETGRVKQDDVIQVSGLTAQPCQLLTVRQFADLIALSRGRVYELIETGIIRHRKILGRIRIPATEYFRLPSERPA